MWLYTIIAECIVCFVIGLIMLLEPQGLPHIVPWTSCIYWTAVDISLTRPSYHLQKIISWAHPDIDITCLWYQKYHIMPFMVNLKSSPLPRISFLWHIWRPHLDLFSSSSPSAKAKWRNVRHGPMKFQAIKDKGGMSRGHGSSIMGYLRLWLVGWTMSPTSLV